MKGRGLKRAIDLFLHENADYTKVEERQYCNGLTALAPKASVGACRRGLACFER